MLIPKRIRVNYVHIEVDRQCIVGAGVLPACSINLHIIQAVTEVISLGLATTVLPVAIAGAIFQVRRYRGRFQGLIRPATRTTTSFLKRHSQNTRRDGL